MAPKVGETTLGHDDARTYTDFERIDEAFRELTRNMGDFAVETSQLLDASKYANDFVNEIQKEFEQEGESFDLSSDPELRDWIVAKVQEKFPNLAPEDIEGILNSVMSKTTKV